jgi:hypothetical protein
MRGEGPVHWAWLWGAILLAIGILDVAVRLVTAWSMEWVVRAEAALLLSTAFGLLMLHRRRPASTARARVIQLGLVASLTLGGLRAALWAMGMPVQYANLAIGILALVGGVSVLWRRRMRPAG